MKKIYTLFLLCFITGTALFAQTKISAEDADKYIGEKVIINGKITGAVYKSSTRQTQLTLGVSGSNEVCTILINLSDRKNFSYTPESFLVNKNVNITGKVVDVNGTPAIYVTKPEDIKFEFEGGADVEFRSLGFDIFNKFFDED